MSDQQNYDARKFLTSNFIKKEDLKRDGPQQFTVQSVGTTPGFKKNGQKEVPDDLLLVFRDERQLGLGTDANLKRMIAWFGPFAADWVGKTIECYYSPDVRGPSGEEGGIRLRLPDAARPAVVSPDYSASLKPGPDVPFEQSELPPPPAPASPKATPPVLDLNNPEDFAMIREALAAYRQSRTESGGA